MSGHFAFGVAEATFFLVKNVPSRGLGIVFPLYPALRLQFRVGQHRAAPAGLAFRWFVPPSHVELTCVRAL